MMKRIIGIIIIMFSFLLVWVLTIATKEINKLSNDQIIKENAKIVDATVINLSDIWAEKERNGRRLSRLYYERFIQFTYNINGINYINDDIYQMSNKSDLINKFKIGDTIQITYDITNPNKSIIGELDEFNININLILSFIIPFTVGLIFVLDKDNKLFKLLEKSKTENSKTKLSQKKGYSLAGVILLILLIFHEYRVNKIYEQTNDGKVFLNFSSIILIIGVLFIIYFLYKCIVSRDIVNKTEELKALQIDTIDYERERVFFVSNENRMYFYETDFGENFKVNEVYKIELSPNNQKVTKINFQGENIRSVRIINVEKSTFELLK